MRLEYAGSFETIISTKPLIFKVFTGHYRMSVESKMAGVAGFEPAHGDTKNRCLTAWLHPNKWKNVGGNGAATRTRTADLMITNQLLYQLSYCGAT